MERTSTILTAWVSDALNASGLSQAALADRLAAKMRVSMDRSKVNKLVLGKRTLSAEEMIAISDICGVPMPTLGQARKPVAVVGRVGAGAHVPLVDAYAQGDGLFFVARPAQIPDKGIAAVQVEGDSMAPMYQPGHILFFSRHADDAVLDGDIGKPCIIEDNKGLAWVKLLKRGTAPGLWNLISLNPMSESTWDTPIKWAAKVSLALPLELADIVA